MEDKSRCSSGYAKSIKSLRKKRPGSSKWYWEDHSELEANGEGHIQLPPLEQAEHHTKNELREKLKEAGLATK